VLHAPSESLLTPSALVTSAFLLILKNCGYDAVRSPAELPVHKQFTVLGFLAESTVNIPAALAEVAPSAQAMLVVVGAVVGVFAL